MLKSELETSILQNTLEIQRLRENIAQLNSSNKTLLSENQGLREAQRTTLKALDAIEAIRATHCPFFDYYGNYIAHHGISSPPPDEIPEPPAMLHVLDHLRNVLNGDR